MLSLKIPQKSATTGHPVTMTIRQKACCTCKFFFFFFFWLIRKKNVLHVQYVSIDLDAILIALPFCIIRFIFFVVYKYY